MTFFSRPAEEGHFYYSKYHNIHFTLLYFYIIIIL